MNILVSAIAEKKGKVLKNIIVITFTKDVITRFYVFIVATFQLRTVGRGSQV